MRLRKASLESIAMQSGDFFKSLVENIEFLRNDGRYTTAMIKESGLMENIRLQTGMKVIPQVRKENTMGAYVLLPNVDRNHPFVNSDVRRFMSNDVGLSALNFKEVAPKGIVNTKTGTVSGWYSEISCDMVLSHLLMEAKGMTNEDIAAIILHELGHLFTYFLHLGNTVVSNLIVSATARSIVKASEYGERVYILTEAERTLGIELPTKEQLAKITSDKEADSVQTIMLTTLADKARYETGFNYYELRSCEQIADQFAIKHGAGIYLASALDKIYTEYGHRSYRNRMLHVLLEIGKLILFCAGLSLGFVIPLAVYVIFTNPLLKEYDDPQQRLDFIVAMLTSEIKDRNLPEERRKQLVADIEIAKGIAAKAKDKRTLFQIYWQYCRTEGNTAVKQEKLAKAIQEFTSTALFLNASKFALLDQ